MLWGWGELSWGLFSNFFCMQTNLYCKASTYSTFSDETNFQRQERHSPSFPIRSRAFHKGAILFVFLKTA